MPEFVEDTPAQKPVSRNKRKRRILIFCGVSVLNVGLLILLLTQLLTPAPSKSAADPLISHPAPNFSLAALHPTAGKSTLSLSDFKGKSIVLIFWASWCEPCKNEAPILEGAWKQRQEQGKNVVFLGVDFEEATSAATGFLQLYNITYPSVLDADGSAATRYGIVSLPDTIFISQQGIVMSKVSQQLTAQLLASGLQSIGV
jgi:cytochrome c biogenesis protein CcmG/thiol:disulfide interchange protein DsbE